MSDAKAKKVNTTEAGPETLFVDLTDAQRLHTTKRTAGTIALHNAMIRNGLQDLYPSDMPPAAVRDLLANEVTATQKVASAGATQKAAVAKRKADEKKAAKLLRRIGNLVDSAYPPGTPARASFFPATPGAHSLAENLEAMSSGLSQHGLPRLPADISVAILVATAHAVARDEDEREHAGTARESAAGAKKSLSVRLSDVRPRLVKALRGFFGEDSPELEKFGLKPIVRKGNTRRRKLTQAERDARRAARERAEAEAKAKKAEKKAEVAEQKAAKDTERAQKAEKEAADAKAALDKLAGNAPKG